jgi:hypothetical protein
MKRIVIKWCSQKSRTYQRTTRKLGISDYAVQPSALRFTTSESGQNHAKLDVMMRITCNDAQKRVERTTVPQESSEFNLVHCNVLLWGLQQLYQATNMPSLMWWCSKKSRTYHCTKRKFGIQDCAVECIALGLTTSESGQKHARLDVMKRIVITWCSQTSRTYQRTTRKLGISDYAV